ncbi:hypothetical protein QEN19_002441 [Hanseniaspora menglaensis]
MFSIYTIGQSPPANHSLKMLSYQSLQSSRGLLIKRLKSSKPTTNQLTSQIGTNQELFFNDPLSQGSTFFQPNGKFIFETLKNFITLQTLYKYGFQQVETPLLFKKELWEKSGHWKNYKEEMFKVKGYRECEEHNHLHEHGESTEDYSLKPMNCPGHALLFKKQMRSYQELPLRFFENSPLHRNERTGALMGLTRLRKFHQDDGHIFCRKDQVSNELRECLKFLDLVYGRIFKFEYELEISTRPETNYLGELEEWELAEKSLMDILNQSNKTFTINKGDGAFYGPKIDCKIKDNNGKKHQVATIQLDFQLPKNFELKFINANNEFEKPIMIHRAILGSIERFMAILLDHYKGDWPFWLNPKQVVILPIKTKDERFLMHAKNLNNYLVTGGKNGENDIILRKDYHFRSHIDSRGEGVGLRIRDNITNGKVSYLVIIGDKEVAENKYSFRSSKNREIVEFLTKEEIFERLVKLEDSFE